MWYTKRWPKIWARRSSDDWLHSALVKRGYVILEGWTEYTKYG
jgi:hypothetical protein